jgi:hypothetical protein
MKRLGVVVVIAGVVVIVAGEVVSSDRTVEDNRVVHELFHFSDR